MSQFNIMKFSYLIILAFFVNISCAFGNSEQIQTDSDTIYSSFTTAELIGKGNPAVVGKEYKLLPEVAKQFELMKTEAQKAGFKIHVVSSYRSYAYQNGIWERKYKSNQAKKIAPKQNIEKIIEYSTIPGTSRHHWGTDLDIIDATKGIPGDPLNEKHFNEGGSMHKFKLWLDENASKYGFYLVYTNNPNRKGFKYEPWHFSYKPIAEPMLQAYKKLDIKKVLQENKLLGSDNFTDDFIEKYKKENILDINPEIK
ncbi:D-alanyl-D-alanine carboxypeptidase [Algoriella xinjiangensis]|uniref:D-alanyl-D-alanine carboxypeptidase n=2 Tax=Algoriella xinjiangensis TaxID=684065 RepID=A0A1I4SNS2_9FLAO|nr:D-alanyl-D-alanine carboxypeptidase [Algoriella xinjiangensis]VDH16214.1 D-alanyl-D-alanine carboxypeptidase [Algoriella xinjiangensis]